MSLEYMKIVIYSFGKMSVINYFSYVKKVCITLSCLYKHVLITDLLLQTVTLLLFFADFEQDALRSHELQL